MRLGALFVLAMMFAAGVARAESPAVVAQRWFDAMHRGDTKELTKLTALPLTIDGAERSDGDLVRCARQLVTSHKALFRMAGEGNSLFASSATEQSVPQAPIDCTSKGRRRPTSRAPAGSHEVTFNTDDAVVVLRISKAGKVVYVSTVRDHGGI